MDDVVIRAARAGDATFLEDMLAEAANTPSQPGRSRADTLADPAVARYVRGWPRATDLGAVADAARQRGLEHISLSVERANPAAALYYAEGYQVLESREHADTMLLDLRPPEDVPRRTAMAH